MHRSVAAVMAMKKQRSETSGARTPAAVTPAAVEQVIHLIRGERVILDQDLARLYGTTTKRLNEQVARNAGRFPEDFSFLLTQKEFSNLRSQIATSSWGGRRQPPRVFTEHGVVMAASVLNSPVAVEASVRVVRAFVQMRELLAQHRDLGHKLEELEQSVGRHDREIEALFEAIRKLLEPVAPKPGRIGFGRD